MVRFKKMIKNYEKAMDKPITSKRVFKKEKRETIRFNRVNFLGGEI
jgi:hypothetical protein